MQRLSDEQIQARKRLPSASLLTEMAIPGVVLPSGRFVGLFGDCKSCDPLTAHHYLLAELKIHPTKPTAIKRVPTS